ncbi:MAG: hypothetical protein V4683_03895 [Bacteroidota bacterium]
MKRLSTFSRNILLLFSLFLSGSCASANTVSEIILVGSTPGDEEIKSALKIPANTKIDFIKWNLKLAENNNFTIDIHFGISQPNTMGFINDGEKRTISGTFTVSKNQNNGKFKQVYDLKSDGFLENLSFAKLTENVFHILTSQNNLMIGNGGWSYSLNRKNPVDSEDVMVSSSVSDEKSLQMIFDGRTPCQIFAVDHPEMKVSDQCIKLKWRLILNRDATTYLPTTYTIRKIVDGRAQMITGKWTIIKGTTKNPDAIIYQIEPDKAEESISFLVGDDNVLFFLNKNSEPYFGNENFSFAMNKKL